jgi:flagellar basal-body rod protein FlgB
LSEGIMQAGFLSFYDGVFATAQGREAQLANNIANANTPGFKAMDMPFQATLAAHLGGATPPDPEYRAGNTVGLDGNDVALDGERVEATKNAEQMMAAATFLHQSTADLITALRPNPSGS